MARNQLTQGPGRGNRYASGVGSPNIAQGQEKRQDSSAASLQLRYLRRLHRLTGRLHHMKTLRDELGPMNIDVPRKAMVAIRDKMMNSPGAADTFIKETRAAFA
jgi:hypothetical protein